MARTARKEAKAKRRVRIAIHTRKLFVWHDGKNGHLSTECRSNPENQSRSGGGRHKGGAGSLEQADPAAAVEQQPQLAHATSLDSASFETPGRSPRLNPEGCLRWTYDTGAAISAFPLDAMVGAETEGNECCYKKSCGELIPDHGGFCVQGMTECGYGVTLRGKHAAVHKTLISASKVHSKGHVAVVDSNGGNIIFCNCALSRKIEPFFQNEIINELGSVRLNGEWHQHATCANVNQSRAVFDACETTVRGLRHPQREVSPMASVGKPHRSERRKHSTSPISGGTGRECKVDSSCCVWLFSDSRRLELEYCSSCRFFCGCEHEC